MVDSITSFAEFDSELYDQTEELKGHLVDVAEDYGFTLEIHEMDFPGVRATTGDHLEVDPGYIEDNALTFLWPELMEEQIEIRIQQLRGSYEDPHYQTEDMKTREKKVSELRDERDHLQDRMRKNMREAEEEGNMNSEEAIERNKELQARIEKLDNQIMRYNQPNRNQANLYMANEQVKKGKDPRKAIAIVSYNPAHYSKDREKLEGFYDEHFNAYEWLSPEARESVIDFVEEINRELGTRAENFLDNKF